MYKTIFALLAGLTVSGCVIDDASLEAASAQDAEKRTTISCGGFAGLQCPTGYECVDVKNDSCDPNKGGADCIGECKQVRGGGKNTECRKPNEYMFSTEECMVVRFICPEGTQYFADDCGCGCEAVGEECGVNTCGEGEYCCNSSCGTCAPEGGFCTQEVCDPVL